MFRRKSEPEYVPVYDFNMEQVGGRDDCKHVWLRNYAVWRQDASSASVNECLDCGKQFRQWSVRRLGPGEIAL